MQVTMRVNRHGGALGLLAAGQTYDVDDALAFELVGAGYAVHVTRPAVPDFRPDVQVVGGGAQYLGPVADSSMPTFGTAGTSLKHIAQRIFADLYDDIEAVQFGFTIEFGQAASASSDAADIQWSVDSPAGGRVQVTFGGSTDGVIPASGVLMSDLTPLGGKLKRGQRLWMNGKVVYRGTGLNGHHRDNRGVVFPDSGEVSAAPLGTSDPGNFVMSGVPTASGSQFILRPVFILGYTSRNTCVILGTSLSAADFSYPMLGSARLDTGIGRSGLQGKIATVNLAQSSDSYTSHATTNNIGLLRFASREAMAKQCNATVVLDEYMRNDSNNGVSVAQMMALIKQMRDRFPNAAYGHTTLTPRTSAATGTYWKTTTDQTIFNALESDYNNAIREMSTAAGHDFFVEVAHAVESSRGSCLWATGATTVGSITIAQTTSSIWTLTGPAGTWSQGTRGAHLLVEPATAGATAVPVLCTQVSADGATATVRGGTNALSARSGVTVITDAVTTDGIHMTRLGERRIAEFGGFDRGMGRFLL